MARAAGRDYRAEYRARLARHPDVPPSVVRGHGPVPVRIAEKLEHGERLTREERKKYGNVRSGAIKDYVKKYGKPSERRKYRPHNLGRRKTEAEAHALAEERGIPAGDDYYRVVKQGGSYVVKVLR